MRSTLNLKDALRERYAWPGGYPFHFLAESGTLCFGCVFKNRREAIRQTRRDEKRGEWNVEPFILWEGPCYCEECGKKMESAYGDIEDEK